MDRRRFIKNGAYGISALPLLSALSNKNKTYRLALIGCGWWGMNILREAIAHQQCKVVGLCDVDMKALNVAADEVKTLNGDTPALHRDYRAVIQKEKPEIVIIGTPDHWHALPAIEAMQAGAHVYLEKPIGHTIGEGQAILRHARDTQRVCQVGTHRRISPHNMSGLEFLRSGKLGKINHVKCFVNYGQGAGSPATELEVPQGLDWDFWVGPAAEQAYNNQIHPKGFRNFLNFANGTIADWGIHWFDQVLWWTEERAPKRIYSTGDRFIREDSSDAPDTQMATYEFETFTLTWENRRCAPTSYLEHNVGCMFYGTEGSFHMGWLDGWTFYPKNKNHEVIQMPAQLHAPDHQNIKELWADFMESIRDERTPVCDIEHGHLATNISLLGMISYKLGRSIEWDGDKEQIINDPEANKLLRRDYRGKWEYPE